MENKKCNSSAKLKFPTSRFWGKGYCFIVLFYYHFAIHTKYTYKILKKDEAREPKKANTAISRKVVGKSARGNPEQYCGWFWVHCSSKKFARIMALEAMAICLRVLKESNKCRFDSYTVSGTFLSYPILPFGIVACTFFSTTFVKIAVLLRLVNRTTYKIMLSNKWYSREENKNNIHFTRHVFKM